MRHQVRPELAAQVRHIETSSTGIVGEALAAFSEAHRGRGLLMAGELVRVLDTLRAAGILVVPFKGPVFSAWLGQPPGAREMTDLDLLIRPADVSAAVHTLTRLAYMPLLSPQAIDSSWLTEVTPELGLVAHDGAVLLELHWKMSPRWYAAPCTVEDVMAQLAEQAFLDTVVQWPTTDALFLAHVADGLKSCGAGVRWIADVARILRQHPDLDWHRVHDTAARRGGLNSVRLAIAVAADLCAEAARMLEEPALELMLPAPARAYAEQARRSSRLRHATRDILARLADGPLMGGPLTQFLWALQVADAPVRATRAIGRHLVTPTVADLATLSPPGESGARMRWRALRRRLGGGTPYC
jgi:hypothetical protein